MVRNPSTKRFDEENEEEEEEEEVEEETEVDEPLRMLLTGRADALIVREYRKRRTVTEIQYE